MVIKKYQFYTKWQHFEYKLALICLCVKILMTNIKSRMYESIQKGFSQNFK